MTSDFKVDPVLDGSSGLIQSRGGALGEAEEEEEEDQSWFASHEEK